MIVLLSCLDTCGSKRDYQLLWSTLMRMKQTNKYAWTETSEESNSCNWHNLILNLFDLEWRGLKLEQSVHFLFVHMRDVCISYLVSVFKGLSLHQVLPSTNQELGTFVLGCLLTIPLHCQSDMVKPQPATTAYSILFQLLLVLSWKSNFLQKNLGYETKF